MMAGDSKFAADVKLPAGVTLACDPKLTVAHLSIRSAVVEETPVAAAPAEGEAAAAPAEGEAAEKKE